MILLKQRLSDGVPEEAGAVFLRPPVRGSLAGWKKLSEVRVDKKM